ncbi:unnamed protein product [Paramecium octaurelia]|uniref:Uncharacterized protein n=1 Tax=Paramecium octaurelia TaxID=43137 RepID=A0A8S1WY61_PAROT|nr:unnamed protein product [Paramecium octaurelia]
MQEVKKELKLIIVGDGAIGKTCALFSYVNDKFPTEYVPTVFDNTITQVEINGEQYQLSLWDTAGQEGYEHLRQVCYQGTDIFLVCFSLVSDVSFENALKKWLPEISLYNKNGFIMFLGLKKDLRDPKNLNHIQTQVAESTIKKMGFQYRETSAMTQDGLKEAFTFSIQSLIKSRQEQQKTKKPKKSSCQLI